MTELYLQRKVRGECVRCGQPCSETSVLCEEHRAEAAARVKTHLAKKRAALRKQKRCVQCEEKSLFYRCRRCRGVDTNHPALETNAA